MQIPIVLVLMIATAVVLKLLTEGPSRPKRKSGKKRGKRRDGVNDKLAEARGNRGEALVVRELERVCASGRHGLTLRNLYVPHKDGSTAEIDVLFITRQGLFVFESKNYSGWIFGNEKDQYWTQTLPGGKNKNTFYNPLKQNQTHAASLREYIGADVPIVPIVVFSGECSIKKLTLTNFDSVVVMISDLAGTVARRIDASAPKLDNGRVQELYLALEPLTRVDESVKNAHVERIRRKYS